MALPLGDQIVTSENRSRARTTVASLTVSSVPDEHLACHQSAIDQTLASGE